MPIVIINTAHVVSMDNYTPCGTSAAGSLLLVMVGNGRWCVGGVCGDFSHTGRLVHKFFVRILPTGPPTWSATFWSADYPFIGPQVRRPAVRILPIAKFRAHACTVYISLLTTVFRARAAYGTIVVLLSFPRTVCNNNSCLHVRACARNLSPCLPDRVTVLYL